MKLNKHEKAAVYAQLAEVKQLSYEQFVQFIQENEYLDPIKII